MAIQPQRTTPPDRAVGNSLRRMAAGQSADTSSGHILRLLCKLGNTHGFHGLAADSVLVRPYGYWKRVRDAAELHEGEARI